MAAVATATAVAVASDQSSEQNLKRATPAPSDLILRVAKGEVVSRTPVWLMRQAGRYMKDFRKYSDRYPFRQRSETPEIAVELSLQCWRRFGMDGVIFFSDILTPLPAMGIDFDVIRGRGPIVLGDLARCLEDRLTGQRKIQHVTDSEEFMASHSFIRNILQTLRKETESNCTLLGFIGAPWTLAAYAVEGGSTKDAATFKKWMYERPDVADEFLERCATTLASYAIFQARSGAQCIQIFDSWAKCLSPEQWQRFAAPHVKRVAHEIRAACPEVPIMYFAHGGSSFMPDQVETLNGVIDVLSVDSHIRLAEAAQVVEGSGIVLQGNIDSFVLRHGSEADIRDAVRRAIDDAGGPGKHIMNLGHGVLQGTPEENVLYFVEEAQTYGAS